MHAIAPRHIRVSTSPNGNRCKANPSASAIAASRRSRGSIRKHLAAPYRRSLFRPRFARPYESHKDTPQAVASAKLLPILSYRTDLEADLPDSAPTLRAPLEAIRKGAAQKPLLFALTRILLCFEPHGACARQQGYAAGRAPSDIALTKNRKALKLLL